MAPEALDQDLISRFPPGTKVGSIEYNRIAASNSMLDLLAKKDPSCVDRYFKTPYINHNMVAPDGIGPVHHLAKWAMSWDGLHTIIRRTVAENDLVLLHSLYSNLADIKGQRVAFDVFRFHEGKIVEHWDCLEICEPPDESGLGRIAGSVDIRDLDKTAQNRATALRFVDEVVIGGKTERAGEFMDTGSLVEHYPERKDGLVRKAAVFVPSDAPRPARYVRYHMTMAEGNFVFVQGEGQIGDDQVLEIYDLFRLEGGKIVEHWDILQPLAPKEKWANPNGPW